MTNKALKAVIDTYGDRIFCIQVNDDHKILIGYKSSPQLSDITLETIGDIDVFKVHQTSKATTPHVSFETMYVTSSINYIGIMDEGDKNYRVDPLIYR